MDNLSFRESLKIVPDMELEMLLEIQQKIEVNRTSLENISELTQKLSPSQKERLREIYTNKIEDYNTSTENFRKKILKMKASMQ